MQATPQTSAELNDYGTLLRRQWWVVVLCLLLGLGAGVGYTYLAATQYTSTTSVLVTSTGVDETSGTTNRAAEINLDTEAQLVTSTEIVGAAAEAIDYTGNPAELGSRVSVTVPPNTEILDIGFTAPTAEGARDGAAAFADAYLDNRQAAAEATLDTTRDSLQARIDDLTAQLESVSETIAGLPEASAGRAFAEAQASSLNSQISSLGTQLNQVGATTVSPGRVITSASLPRSPSSPDLTLDVAAGGLLGLLLGIGLAVLRQRADRVLRRAADVERRAGLAVLAELPGAATQRADLVFSNSAEGRSYARLRNVVTSSLSDHRVVLVAGVTGPAGPVAANLAASLARSGEEVVLVCGDVHAGTAHELLHGRTGTGLSEVLAGRAKLSGARRRVVDPPSLRVVGPGRNPDQAAVLLQTGSPRQLVEELLTTARWVVLEAPATTSGADAQTLAALADLAVLVIRTEETRLDDVADARAQFESVRTVLLGAVVVAGEKRADKRADREPVAAVPVPVPLIEDELDTPAPAGRSRRTRRAAVAVTVDEEPAESRDDDADPVDEQTPADTHTDTEPAGPVPHGASAVQLPGTRDDDPEHAPAAAQPAGG